MGVAKLQETNPNFSDGFKFLNNVKMFQMAVKSVNLNSFGKLAISSKENLLRHGRRDAAVCDRWV